MANSILEQAGLPGDLPLCFKPICFYRVDNDWIYTVDTRSAFHKDPGDVVDAIVPTYENSWGRSWILTDDLRETMEAIRNPPPGFLYVRLPGGSVFGFDLADAKFADELPLPMLAAPLGEEHTFPSVPGKNRNRLSLEDFTATVKKFGTVHVPWISRRVHENSLDLLAGYGCVASNAYRNGALGTVRYDPVAAKKRLQLQRQKKKKRAAEHAKQEKEREDRIQRIQRGELTAIEFDHMWSAFVAYIGDGVYDLAMHIPGYAKYSYGSRHPPHPIPARKFARAMEVYEAIAPFLPRRTRQRILKYTISDNVPFGDIPQECLPFPFNQIRGYLERKSP